MEAGAVALIIGLAGAGAIAYSPRGWLKAAGGLLIALTVGFILIDALQLLAR